MALVSNVERGHFLNIADQETAARLLTDRNLLAIPGVSRVTLIGGSERQFQVVAHPDALRANNVSLTELLDAARGASENASAGVYVEGPQEYVLQAVGSTSGSLVPGVGTA